MILSDCQVTSSCSTRWHVWTDVLLTRKRKKRKEEQRENDRYMWHRLTWRVPLVEQELLTLPEHLSSTPVFSGVHVTRSIVLCVCFVDRCLSFLFFFAIVLFVLLWNMDCDYLYGIFKLFLENIVMPRTTNLQPFKKKPAVKLYCETFLYQTSSETNFCIRNKHVFGLKRLCLQIFPTFEIYLRHVRAMSFSTLEVCWCYVH